MIVGSIPTGGLPLYVVYAPSEGSEPTTFRLRSGRSAAKQRSAVFAIPNNVIDYAHALDHQKLRNKTDIA